MKDGNRPRVVCLCGSTRFKQAFIDATFRETMAGKIVLGVGFYGHADAEVYTPTEDVKARVDELHLRKIDLADEVLVLNCLLRTCPHCERTYPHTAALRVVLCACGAYISGDAPKPYIGDSTRREIAYAESLGKPVRYLFPQEA